MSWREREDLVREGLGWREQEKGWVRESEREVCVLCTYNMYSVRNPDLTNSDSFLGRIKTCQIRFWPSEREFRLGKSRLWTCQVWILSMTEFKLDMFGLIGFVKYFPSDSIYRIFLFPVITKNSSLKNGFT